MMLHRYTFMPLFFDTTGASRQGFRRSVFGGIDSRSRCLFDDNERFESTNPNRSSERFVTDFLLFMALPSDMPRPILVKKVISTIGNKPN